MKAILILFLSILSQVSFAKGDLMQVEPFSLSSLEEQFPETVVTETVVDGGEKSYTKKTGPSAKEVKSVSYEKLVPYLITVIQQQQKEIEQLKLERK